MKRITKLLCLFVVILTVTGCSNNGGSRNRVNNSNSVDKVINDQIGNIDSATGNVETQSPAPEDNSETDNLPGTLEKTDAEDAGGVDYDLTAMNSDMVYATVYQMMADPDTYIGKTFRMDGLYYATYYEPTAKYYHYCIIQDATACCAQGIEFVWEDGSHIYPDEYPEENAGIIVQGTFETYQEDGDSNLYCRLKDATLEIRSN